MKYSKPETVTIIVSSDRLMLAESLTGVGRDDSADVETSDKSAGRRGTWGDIWENGDEE